MHITRYTDYSLRVLMYLAVAGDKTVTIRDIADSYDISRNHLMKIVQELNARGYLKATRGKNGGLKLADKPENIRVGKLVREFEQGAPLVECFGGDNQCVITPACRLKHVFSEALASFFRTLDQYTLADLAPARPNHVGQALAALLPAVEAAAGDPV
ncbi:MAG: Rrf2 family transcriptional regulator [Alphaproteobacteria bacterium]|nr:MAG: Rrf2 family transcriptional regulator [Alphaproteobacteria bacterium]